MATKKNSAGKQSSSETAIVAKSSLSKAAFVRSLSVDMPAKEVVERAAAAGLIFSDKYVYNIRHAAKSSAGVVKRPVGRPPSRAVAPVASKSPAAPKAKAKGRPLARPATPAAAPAAAAPRAVTPKAVATVESPSRIEDLLRAVAAELGLGRAIAVLEAERNRVRSVFGG